MWPQQPIKLSDLEKSPMKHVGLLNKHQSDLPRPIKIRLGCVYGVELCTKLQHSVSWKCVRKIVLNHL